MDNKEYFTEIEETIKQDNIELNKEDDNSFIKELPDWDLEPPYDPIKRENKK